MGHVRQATPSQTLFTSLCPPPPAQVGKGQQVVGLELHGRRLLVITADTTARVYLAHRPGEQRTSRRQARRAAAAAEPQQQAAAAREAAAAAQQVEPAEWQARSVSDAEAAARAAKQRQTNSLFYDDSAAWLTLHLTLTNTLEKQPLRCAALSPGRMCGAAAGTGCISLRQLPSDPACTCPPAACYLRLALLATCC